LELSERMRKDMIAGLRVSSVLTLFLVWPIALACLMIAVYWTNFGTVAAYLGIILTSCLTTATIALFCSVLFHKTSVSLMTTYLIIVVLFFSPVAVSFFADTFFPDEPVTQTLKYLGITSPFSTTFNVPSYLETQANPDIVPAPNGNWGLVALYETFTLSMNVVLFGLMLWLFNYRWRVTG
jgi:hypothetical protein